MLEEQEVLFERNLEGRLGFHSPCTVDRGQWKTRDMKERGWVVCSWLPSLNEAVDGRVYKRADSKPPTLWEQKSLFNKK